MHERRNGRVREDRGLAPRYLAEVTGDHQAHVQEEQGQDAFEQIEEHRLQHGLARFGGDVTDDHRTQQQDLRTVGERLMQDLPGFDAAGRGVTGLIAQEAGRDHREDDGGGFHDRHRGGHMTAEGESGVLHPLRRGDEGHGADRTEARRHADRIEGGQELAEEEVAEEGDERRQKDGAAQIGEDALVETGLGQGEATLQTERNQEHLAEHPGRLGGNFQI